MSAGLTHRHVRCSQYLGQYLTQYLVSGCAEYLQRRPIACLSIRAATHDAWHRCYTCSYIAAEVSNRAYRVAVAGGLRAIRGSVERKVFYPTRRVAHDAMPTPACASTWRDAATAVWVMFDAAAAHRACRTSVGLAIADVASQMYLEMHFTAVYETMQRTRLIITAHTSDAVATNVRLRAGCETLTTILVAAPRATVETAMTRITNYVSVRTRPGIDPCMPCCA